MMIGFISTSIPFLLLCVTSPFAARTEVSIEGDKFLINGHLTYERFNPKAHGLLMNVRMVNSVFTDENPATRPDGFDPDKNTRAFIESMGEYRAKGVLGFTVNLQGGFPGYEGAINSAFRPDGSLKPEYMARVAQVIERADELGMVIILGFFYQRQDQILIDEDAVRTATRNAASWVRDRRYQNVLIEIANEYRHPGFDHRIILDEDGEVELMDICRSVAPNLLVSTSGMGDMRFHETLAKNADYILVHGNTTDPEDYSERIAVLKRYGKPVVINEDWCFPDDPRGRGDAIEKLTAAFENHASWGIMNQKRNQQYPFLWGIGKPDEGDNSRLDFLTYQKMAELIGIDSN